VAESAVEAAEQQLGQVMADEVVAFGNKAAELNLDMQSTQ